MLLVLVAPATGVAGQEAGSVDLLLRYEGQVSFTVGDDGRAFNANQVQADPGAAMEATLSLKARGRDNSLTVPAAWNITLALEDGTLLGVLAGQWEVGETATRRVSLPFVLPEATPVGTTHLVARLTTGAYDPDPSNNDPDPVLLFVGEPAGEGAAPPTRLPYLGASLLGLLGLGALAIAWVPSLRGRLEVATARAGAWREARLERWVHLEAATRARIVRTRLVAAAALLLVLLFAAAGRIAPTAHSVMDTLGLALGLGVPVAAGSLLIRRTQEGAWDTAAAVRTGLTTGLVVLVLGLVWQQAAASTELLRWPDVGGLGRFVVLGLSIGAVYGLIALGYTMVYGVLKFINFAHGDLFAWGGYFAWLFVVQFPVLPLWAAVLASVTLTAALGVGIERVAYRPLRGGDRLTPLITAIAVSLLLSSAAQFWFGTSRRTFTEPGTYRDSATARWLETDRTILGAPVSNLDLTIIVVSLLLVVGVSWLVRRSRMGQAMRAVADDMETARTIGLPVDRVISWTFLLGSAMAAVGGALWGLRFTLHPTLGLHVGIKAFTAAVVGGIGNIQGAFLGGVLIGLAENVGGQFIDSRFQNAIAFAILILFLLWRPRGLIPSDQGVARK